MILNSLIESNDRNELILIEGGICQFYKCKNGSLTIRSILSQRPGAGSEMLQKLIDLKPPFITAKVPLDWAANSWYEKRGFTLLGRAYSRGRQLNKWVLILDQSLTFETTLQENE